MQIFPREKKIKAGQFGLMILAALFFFVAGFHYWDESYPWYSRVAGVVGVIIFCCAIIILGYTMVYYGWFVVKNR